MIWAKLHVIYLNNKNGGILLQETTLIVKKKLINYKYNSLVIIEYSL